MDARAEILRAVRAASPATAPAAPARVQSGGVSSDLLSAFESELRLLTAIPHRADAEANLPQVVAGIASAAGARRIAAWPSPLLRGLPQTEPLVSLGMAWAFAPEAAEGDRQAWRTVCIEADIGITEADYALADTGTLVLRAGPGQARMASLVPPIHIAVVRSERLLPHLDALFAALGTGRESLTSTVTLITGPSRTADIEKKIVLGVHGPETLHVVTVG